jgi:hypothetical protein
MDESLQTHSLDKVVSAYYGKDKLGVALHSPAAFTELLAAPVMNYITPRLKMAVFGELVDRIKADNPGKPLEQLTHELNKAWGQVEGIGGQVGYDRLFINGFAKNLVQAVTRSAGWTGGTLVTLFGGMKDAAMFMHEWQKTGALPKNIPDRVAYSLSLIIGIGLANGIMTKMFTGEDPKERDFLTFRTGEKDEYGKDRRFVLPSYGKDYNGYVFDFFNTLKAKTGPLVNAGLTVAHNKDYYGNKVYNEEDKLHENAFDLAKFGIQEFTPFWIRGVMQNREKSGKSIGGFIAPLVGIMPAPRRMTETSAEKKMDEYVAAEQKETGRTKQEVAKRDLKKQIYRSFRESTEKGNAALGDAIKNKQITLREAHEMKKNRGLNTFVSTYQRLTVDKALKVWDLASDEEKKILKPSLAKKVGQITKLPLDEQPTLMKKIKEDLNDKPMTK